MIGSSTKKFTFRSLSNVSFSFLRRLPRLCICPSHRSTAVGCNSSTAARVTGSCSLCSCCRPYSRKCPEPATEPTGDKDPVKTKGKGGSYHRTTCHLLLLLLLLSRIASGVIILQIHKKLTNNCKIYSPDKMPYIINTESFGNNYFIMIINQKRNNCMIWRIWRIFTSKLLKISFQSLIFQRDQCKRISWKRLQVLAIYSGYIYLIISRHS